MEKIKVSMGVFLLGILALGLSLIVPPEILSSYTNLRPIGLTTLYICPLLGIIGILFAIKEKALFFGLANILLILAFPLVMFIGYRIL